MDKRTFTASDLIEALHDVIRQASKDLVEAAVFPRRFEEHLGENPFALPVLEESFPATEHPNLHLALTSIFDRDEWSTELFGFISEQDAHGRTRIVDLLVEKDPEAVVGPVTHKNVEIEEGVTIACIQKAVFLASKGDERFVVLVLGPNSPYQPTIHLEVMTTNRERGERLLLDVRQEMNRINVYRGKVLTLDTDQMRTVTIKVKSLPAVEKKDLILPEPVLDRLDRQIIRFSRQVDRLRAAGQHLKRGVLLHGEPGTGKTLSAMYVSGEMPDRTIIILTGHSIGLIEDACDLARKLQPSTVLIEDVDLIAGHRAKQSSSTNAVLFDLLNQMDGLSEDAEVLFILTSNRPDQLEAALSSRPGRVDSAIEIPPPDATCRLRLLQLYSRKLNVADEHLQPFIDKTKGASAAFIRELMRQASVVASEDGDQTQVGPRHIDLALNALTVEGGDLTRNLLGTSLDEPASQ